MSQLTDVELKDFLINDTNGVIEGLFDLLDNMGNTEHSTASDWCYSQIPAVIYHQDFPQWSDTEAHLQCWAVMWDSFKKIADTYMATVA